MNFQGGRMGDFRLLRASKVCRTALAIMVQMMLVVAYTLEVRAEGFQSYQKTGVVVDVGSAIQLEVVMELAGRSETVNVTENATGIETSDTQLGQAIASKQITDVPLNGRSYTDLLASPSRPQPDYDERTEQQYLRRHSRVWRAPISEVPPKPRRRLFSS
jgi:hypothetical protein